MRVKERVRCDLRRMRGRRGLDVLARLRESTTIDIEVLPPDEHADTESSNDAQVVSQARRLGGRVITNDPNLVKIAALQDVQAININDVAVALKPTCVPGDLLNVRLVKPGEEMGQGVGYLDDGTMVVVEGGRDQLGRTVHVSVTSTLQTSAGRLVFARPELGRG